MRRHSAFIGFTLLLGFAVLQAEVCRAQSQPSAPTHSQTKPDHKASPGIDPENLKRYVGRYRLEVGLIPISTLDVTLEDAALWVKPSVVKKRRLLHKSGTVFLDEVEGARYIFNREIDGNSSSVTFEFEGAEYTAQRVVLPAPSLKGNTTFRLRGFADAHIVALAGSFNDWDESKLICGREDGAWVCRLDLEPGSYTYKFIVDGNWILDPDNPITSVDDAGNTNNVLIKR
jgi:hypothetical protein